MDLTSDDRFIVFVRADAGHWAGADANETPLAVCDSYEEARRVKEEAACDCVIRYAGCTGGGD